MDKIDISGLFEAIGTICKEYNDNVLKKRDMRKIETKVTIDSPYGEIDLIIEYHWEGPYMAGDEPVIDKITPVFYDEADDVKDDINKYLKENASEVQENIIYEIVKE
jgi:hypothetical protein